MFLFLSSSLAHWQNLWARILFLYLIVQYVALSAGTADNLVTLLAYQGNPVDASIACMAVCSLCATRDLRGRLPCCDVFTAASWEPPCHLSIKQQ